MNKLIYYSVLVAAFIVLWAIMITLFVVMEDFGYKPGSVLFIVGFSIIFGIVGGMKPWLKKKLEKRNGKSEN